MHESALLIHVSVNGIDQVLFTLDALLYASLPTMNEIKCLHFNFLYQSRDVNKNTFGLTWVLIGTEILQAS